MFREISFRAKPAKASAVANSKAALELSPAETGKSETKTKEKPESGAKPFDCMTSSTRMATIKLSTVFGRGVG